MTDKEKLSCLTDRPCSVCKHKTENGCTKWSCVFGEKSALSENKGEWLEAVEKRFPNGEKQMWHHECSVCSTCEPPYPMDKEHWEFCPNCGADMREPKGEKGTERCKSE